MRFRRILQVFCLIMVATTAVFAQQTKSLAENFSGATMDGRTIELESMRGKVVVMTFWSTRCAICVAEIPKLNQLVANYNESDVVFLGLTADDPSVVEGFVKNRPFNINLMPDSFGVVLKYADRDREGNLKMGFPAYFVINQQGEIELKASGWNKTNAVTSQVNRLLSNRQAKVE